MSWGNPQSAKEIAVAVLLSPLSFCYSLGNKVNALSYKWKIRKRYRPAVPVISVGNITVGGTGKTPIVIEIARQFTAQGLKVGIASRGYKRESSASLVIAGDGSSNFADVREAGDEPCLIARSVPRAVVITSSDRALASKMLVERFECDVIILDDGFQHYRVERDLDIVLIDYSDHPTKDSVLPAGRLREELNGLSRADHIVVTKVPTAVDQKHWQYLQSVVEQYAPGQSRSACRFNAGKLVHTNQNDKQKQASELAPTALSGISVVAFSGIARPAAFLNELEDLGAKVVAEKRFPDHHAYTPADLEILTNLKAESSAQYLVTTAKDAVKLPYGSAFDCLVLEQTVEWLTALPAALNLLSDRIKSANIAVGNTNQFLNSSKLEQNAIHSK